MTVGITVVIVLALLFICGGFNSPIYQYRARQFAQDIGGENIHIIHSDYSCVNLWGFPGSYCGASAIFITAETESSIEQRIISQFGAKPRIEHQFNELSAHEDWMQASGINLVTNKAYTFPIKMTQLVVNHRGSVWYVTPRYESDYFTLKGESIQGAIIHVHINT